MSGAAVPYHMRQNKAVDRQLFIELLSKINRYSPISTYDYFSFGGAFLEDFKLIHSHFGNNKLFSIENDPTAFARQKFNLPLSCIKCIKLDSADFVDGYEGNNNAIIWLDFASASQTREQLQQFQTLLTKLRTLDIVKLTLNSNPDVLHGTDNKQANGERETIEERLKRRFLELQHRIGDYLPHDASEKDMTINGLPKILCQAAEFAANQAMNGKLLENNYFQPLAAFTYSDSQHQMLTVTGIILPMKEKQLFFEKTQVKRWKAASLVWGNCKPIMVPALTAREKLFIDQLLPHNTGKQIQKKLKFLLDKKKEQSLSLIDNYRLYYRYYPSFHKVNL